MEILLPKRNSNTNETINTKKMVVVGSNGSGKTRFGTDIENRYSEVVHRISAQKSLTMPKEVSPKTMERANNEFLYGYFNQNSHGNSLAYKHTQRWGERPNTFLLNDYEKLMVLLHTDEYEESIKFKAEYNPGQNLKKPITKLDRIKLIWEYVLPHRKLLIKAGSIETYPSTNPSIIYNASEMSDGERVIFYLIGEIVSVPINSIIIIDEPEMHLHKSIVNRLWDCIENERNDCTFIYLTHDIEFASSRESADKIWIKSFDGEKWDYEILPIENELPEQLYLEILGSRNPVLFIEGDISSIDYKLLQQVFNEYTVKPLGSCTKVINTTKSFNEQIEFHHIISYGLIDKDRRSDEEIQNIKDNNIWVLKVAEIENMLLLEPIINQVAIKMNKNPENIFEQVKNNVIEFFNNEIESQALIHSKSQIGRMLNAIINYRTEKNIDLIEQSLANIQSTIFVKKIYQENIDKFKEFVISKDYNSILTIFNNKGIIANSNVANLCDLNTKNEAYLNAIIGILKANIISSRIIRESISNAINRNA